MDATTKALLAKAWKNEDLDLGVGRHYFDEQFVVRVSGSVEKHEDQLVAPTVSIPLVTTLALFFDKCGVTRDAALNLLREAITEAMDENVNEDAKIKERIGDVEKAIKAVKDELIGKLPKMKRSGKVITKNLEVTLTPVMAEELAAA
ncbi:MAG: hypothetical protein H6822_22150 [Planctomycetaceae bacterium]|nr:hypothetical protein [Planctomycetaceae bacterium]